MYSTFMILECFLESEMFQTNVVEKTKKKNFMFNNLFPPKKRDVYEIMPYSTVQSDRPQMTTAYIWRMRFACWIAKATHTHTHTHTQNM